MNVVWRGKVLLPAGIAVAVVGGVAGLLLWAEVRLGGSVLLGVAGLPLLSFLAVFGNAAVLVAAAGALRGRPVGVRSGYGRVAGRWRALARWAPAGVVQVLSALLVVGLPWSLRNYLVVPAVLLDGVGVRAAMHGSREVYRRDTGAFLRGTTLLGLPFVVAFLPSVVLLLVGATAAERGPGALLMAGGGLLLWAGSSLTVGLFGVFRTRLYLESKGAAGPEPARSVLHVSPVE
ncbi:hypothetical protein [Kitasatospora sp. NPDC059827]|uniref:hypothetical protein n=1 Tax=Kitasatospora sp. NPDC059827 TaxID=3346964 RepID=UPI0036690431